MTGTMSCRILYASATARLESVRERKHVEWVTASLLHRVGPELVHRRLFFCSITSPPDAVQVVELCIELIRDGIDNR